MNPLTTSVAPALVTSLGGQQSARTIHFVVAVLLVGFVIGHVAMVAFAGFSRHVAAMILGREPSATAMVAVGCDAVETNTFNGSRNDLEEANLADQAEELNRVAAQIESGMVFVNSMTRSGPRLISVRTPSSNVSIPPIAVPTMTPTRSALPSVMLSPACSTASRAAATAN